MSKPDCNVWATPGKAEDEDWGGGVGGDGAGTTNANSQIASAQ